MDHCDYFNKKFLSHRSLLAINPMDELPKSRVFSRTPKAFKEKEKWRNIWDFKFQTKL